MEYKLKDIITFKPGYAFKKSDMTDTGIDLVKIGNLKNNKVIIPSGVKIKEDTKFQDFIINKGDILMALTGDPVYKGNIQTWVGRTSIYLNNKVSYLNQRVCKLIPNEKIIFGDYLYYWLIRRDKTYEIAGLFHGSANQANISHKEVGEMFIELPSLEIQKKASNILSDIDKKIELNNEINNNLYEISKQLLLKYLDENKSSDEINISKFLNIFTGKKNANETSPTGKYKFFSCAPESLLSDTYLCDSAAIIVAGNGAYTGRTRFYDGKFELYQRTYGLTLKDDFEKNNIYGLYVFMKTIFEPDKMGGTHGSAIPYIVLSDLTDYKLKYNKVEFDRFSNLVSGNIKMIQENEKSNEKLSELRDTLLPKLMNGEIDLDNIEI